MILEAYRNPHSGDYDRYEDPVYVHGPMVAFILAIILERSITLLYWGYEANPLVQQLGVWKWLLVSIVACATVPYLWYYAEGFDSRIVRGCLYFLSLLHFVAFGSNLLVVLGYL